MSEPIVGEENFLFEQKLFHFSFMSNLISHLK